MTRSHRRGPWLPEEDATLMQLVQSQGPNNWVRISQHMHYRSPKQCRERFHQNLKPTLNHEPITADEGEMIEQMVGDMGKRWAEIARRLGNRSDNAVKNWWNGSMNRRRRNVIQSSSKTLSNRLEPLSATRPPIAAIPSTDPRQHSYTRSWNGPQHSHVSQSSYSYAHPSSYSASQYRQQEDHQPSAYRSLASTINERREQQLPPLGLPRPATMSFPPTSFANYSPPESGLGHSYGFSSASRPPAMILLPSPQRQLEPPLVSPVGSEISLAPSLAPSLISDHNSNSSISPKTMHSPRPDLPAPIDSRSHAIRRGSAGSLSMVGQSYHTDEGYVSALSQSASLVGKQSSVQLPLPRFEEAGDSDAVRWQPGHHFSHSASMPSRPPSMEQSGSDREPKSARDTRMTFSSLLN